MGLCTTTFGEMSLALCAALSAVIIVSYIYLTKLISFGLWMIETPHSKYVENFDFMLQNIFSVIKVFSLCAMYLIEYTMVRINIYRIFRWILL